MRGGGGIARLRTSQDLDYVMWSLTVISTGQTQIAKASLTALLLPKLPVAVITYFHITLTLAYVLQLEL